MVDVSRVEGIDNAFIRHLGEQRLNHGSGRTMRTCRSRASMRDMGTESNRLGEVCPTIPRPDYIRPLAGNSLDGGHDDVCHSVWLGNEEHVRAVEFSDGRAGPFRHKPLPGWANRDVVRRDDCPRRKRLPSDRTGRLAKPDGATRALRYGHNGRLLSRQICGKHVVKL